MVSALSRPRKAFAFVLVWLAVACRALAAPPEVRDEAAFFSPAAVGQANAAILQMKRLYKKDLHVETFLAPPANLKDQFQKNSNKAFADWAASEAAKDKVDGIYVLICKTPPHLEVLVDNASLKKAFLAKDRDKLRDVLLGHFRDKTYDKGLSAITALVRERFEQNLGPAVLGPTLNVVQDQGQFFSQPVEQRINLEIKEFNQRFKKDLLIETFAAPPADTQKLLAAANAADKAKILASWLHERAKATKADGIAVLICREPARIQVEVSAAMEKKAFSAMDRDQLVGMLIAHFKAKEFDKALESTLDFVYDTVDRNLSPASAPPVGGSIKDNAGLFGAAAELRASQDGQRLAREYRQTLTIETFPQPPAGQVKRVEAMSADARNAFFADWLKERMPPGKFDGIYLLICKQPGSFQIGLGESTRLKAFTPADRDELAKILREPFQAKQFDQGLLRALDFINVTIARNMGGLAIRDEAGFFKAEILFAANRELLTLRQKEGQEIRIETVASLPGPKKLAYLQLDNEDTKGRKQLLADWQAERAKAAGSPGIHILICQDPPQVLVAAAEGAQKKLGPADRDQLRDLISARLAEKAADKGLTEATAFLRDTLPVRDIQDEAGFFSPEAIDKANAAIRELRRRFQKEVVVESFKEIPSAKAAGFDLQDPAARSKVFAAWAEERRKSLQADGVSILICKNPMNLQVATAPKGIFAEQRDEVVKLLLASFKEKQYDAGLAEALQFINRDLQQKLASTPPVEKKDLTALLPKIEQGVDAKTPPTTVPVSGVAKNDASPSATEKERVGFDVKWIIWGFAILGGLWLLIGIMRALFGAGRPAPPQAANLASPMTAVPPQSYGNAPSPQRPYPQQQPYPPQQPYSPHQPYHPQQPYPIPQQAPPAQGGGFMPGLLGGLFGGVAGGWIHDRMRGSGNINISHSTPVPPPSRRESPPPTKYEAPPPDPAVGGYSGSGGDFGDAAPAQPGYASSGGDFGQAPPVQPDFTSSGGDFGQAPPPPPDYANSGGDFGQPAAAPPDVATSGGDFDAPPQDIAIAGGDFSAPEPPASYETSAGGDFAPPPEPAAYEPPPQESSGGDFGGGSVDTSGGDFGGSAPNEG